ncbi:splicing factor, proline- and glutamine-rich-like [Dorcoceras hygrometricum]|uniref:Splicing factor, proline-and glutamine-rich-like n=1 Tax=Dorcoceras hygrometricum TaxID=472368 RepID=A0A2Z7AD70_9LAMI|nr:splicing factor, proline- and glutamine-rich-like [Dorcoceras hygrometricum]
MATFLNNALQVNFDSVLNMDDEGMVRMFKTLEESRLRGFLGVSGFVFEEALNQFFANATIIAGVIVSTVAKKKLVDLFSEMFHLPSKGIISFYRLPAQAVEHMKVLFFATDALFKPSSKNREMKVEYRLLNDIMSKSLTSKASSFDSITTERFDMMVVITARIKIN